MTDYGIAIPDKPAPVKIPEKALEDALDAGMQASEQASTGFQRYWHEQLLKRQRQRDLEKAREERRRLEEKKKDAAKPAAPTLGRDEVDLE